MTWAMCRRYSELARMSVMGEISWATKALALAMSASESFLPFKRASIFSRALGDRAHGAESELPDAAFLGQDRQAHLGQVLALVAPELDVAAGRLLLGQGQFDRGHELVGKQSRASSGP